MKKKIIIISSLIIILLIVVFSVYSNYIYNHKYEEYRKNYDSIVLKVDEDKFDEVIAELDNISNTYFGKKNKEEIILKKRSIEDLKDNKNIYDYGVKLYEQGKHLEAIEMLGNVPTNDTKRSHMANIKIDDIKKQYIVINLVNAKNEASKDLKNAMKFLDKVIDMDAANVEAINLKKEYGERLVIKGREGFKAAQDEWIAKGRPNKPDG